MQKLSQRKVRSQWKVSRLRIQEARRVTYTLGGIASFLSLLILDSRIPYSNNEVLTQWTNAIIPSLLIGLVSIISLALFFTRVRKN